METFPVHISFAAPSAIEVQTPPLRAEDRELIQAVKALNHSEMFRGR